MTLGRFPAPMVAPPSTPADYGVLNVGQLVTITTNQPAAVKANGVAIGTTAGNPAVLNWTPGVTANYRITATAKGVTSPERRVTVAGANLLPDLAAWGRTGVNAPVAMVDPVSDRAFYRVTYQASAGHHFLRSNPIAGSVANGSNDLWVRAPVGGSGWIAVQISSAPENAILWINLTTKEARGQKCAGWVVEEAADGFMRLQLHALTGGVCNETVIFCNVTKSGSSLSVLSTTMGGEYLDIAAPRAIDATVDLPDNFKFHAVSETVTAEGIKRYATTTPFSDTIATMLNPGRLDVLEPDVIDPAKRYQMVILPGVEAMPGNVYAAELPRIAAANLHNTFDTFFVQWSNRTALYPWWGRKADGSNDYEGVLVRQVIPWMRERYPIFAGREGVGLLGWSKGAWGSASLLFRNMAAIGFAALWDIDWNEIYGAADSGGVADYGETDFFGSSSQFDLHNPKAILAGMSAATLAGIQDKPRIYLSGAARFNTDTIDCHDALTAKGVPHGYFYIDANDLGAGGFNHNADFGWIEGGGLWSSYYGGPSVAAELCKLMRTGLQRRA